jgi:hypothetical protein
MYIKLFEDFEKSMKDATTVSTQGWVEIRDTIQSKLPFIIVVFKNRDSYETAIATEFGDDSYIKQTAMMSNNGTQIKYPSLFLILDDESRFSNKIQNLYERFKIKAIILNGKGDEYAQSYSQDGTSVNLGNEIVSSLSIDDMANNDMFKIGSTYYRFIDFISR